MIEKLVEKSVEKVIKKAVKKAVKKVIKKVVEKEILIINNLKINYKIAGEGPAVLVLHGWGGSSDSWVKVQEILAEHGYKVIVPDLPGFGKTITPPNPWGVEEYINWLANFLEGVKKNYTEFREPFFLLGHSFGGQIAVKFAAEYPERLKNLILCDSAAIRPKPGLKKRTIFRLARIGNAVFSPKHLIRFKDSARNFFYIFLRHKDYVKADGTMKETIKKVLGEDLFSELPKVKTNTLIIWGGADKILPLKCAHILNENIKDSTLEILPKVGHSPHLEVPEKLSKIILNFLANKST